MIGQLGWAGRQVPRARGGGSSSMCVSMILRCKNKMQDIFISNYFLKRQWPPQTYLKFNNTGFPRFSRVLRSL